MAHRRDEGLGLRGAKSKKNGDSGPRTLKPKRETALRDMEHEVGIVIPRWFVSLGFSKV